MTCGEDGTCGYTCSNSEDCGVGRQCEEGECVLCGRSDESCPCCEGYQCNDATELCERSAQVGAVKTMTIVVVIGLCAILKVNNVSKT